MKIFKNAILYGIWEMFDTGSNILEAVLGV